MPPPGGPSRRRQAASPSTSSQPQPPSASASQDTPLPSRLPPSHSIPPLPTLFHDEEAGVDWDLFTSVLSRLARDDERQTSHLSNATPRSGRTLLAASQATPTGSGRRISHRSREKQKEKVQLAESWEEEGDEELPNSNDSQFMSEDPMSLPSADDSQFEPTVKPPAKPTAVLLAQRARPSEDEDDEGSLPRSSDSQFSVTLNQRTTKASARPAAHEDDDNESLPSLNDSQFEASSPIRSTATVTPLHPPAPATRQNRRQAALAALPARRSAPAAPPLSTPTTRVKRQTSTASDLPPPRRRTRQTQTPSSSLTESLPRVDNSQFEQTMSRSTRARTRTRQAAAEAIREESAPISSQLEEDDGKYDVESDGLPDPEDSQFERTQTPRKQLLSRGESAEMAAAEKAVLPSPEDAEEEGIVDPTTAMIQEDEPEAPAEISALGSQVIAIEERMVVEEESLISPAIQASQISITEESITAVADVPKSSIARTLVNNPGTPAAELAPATVPEEAMNVDDERAEEQAIIEEPDAGELSLAAVASDPEVPTPVASNSTPALPRSALPTSTEPALANPSPSQHRRTVNDPTEFAPPDEGDMTELERRGEEPLVRQPQLPLHGPRKPRSIRIRGPPAEDDVEMEASTLLAAQEQAQEDKVAIQADNEMVLDPSDEARLETESLILDDELLDEMREIVPEDPPLSSQRRRDQLAADEDEDDVADPASAQRRAPTRPRQRHQSPFLVPDDPYMVTEDGDRLRPSILFTVPKGYVFPKSRIHGQLPGQKYTYSRKNGRRVRWTPTQSLLLWRTVQQVPMSVDNPITVVAYFYGEYGVHSQDLAIFNNQHMRGRMTVMCETRTNRGDIIEGRARMFLGPKDPRRIQYESEKEEFWAREAEEELRIKQEQEEMEMASLDEGDEEEFEDGREHDEDQAAESQRGHSHQPDRDDYGNDYTDDTEEYQSPVTRRRPARDLPRARKRPHITGTHTLPQLPRPSLRAAAPAKAKGKRPAPSTPSESSEAEKQYFRRRHADFAHLPPFELDTSPTPPPSPSPEPPSPPPRRRQSAPGWLRVSRPRASRRTAFDDIMERSDEDARGSNDKPRAQRRGARPSGAWHRDRDEAEDDAGDYESKEGSSLLRATTSPSRRVNRRTLLSVEPPPVRNRASYIRSSVAPERHTPPLSRWRTAASARRTLAAQAQGTTPRRVRQQAAETELYEPGNDGSASDDKGLDPAEDGEDSEDGQEAEEEEGEGEAEEENPDESPLVSPQTTRKRGRPPKPLGTTTATQRRTRATIALSADEKDEQDGAGDREEMTNAEGDSDADAEASLAVRRRVIRERVLRGGL